MFNIIKLTEVLLFEYSSIICIPTNPRDLMPVFSSIYKISEKPKRDST